MQAINHLNKLLRAAAGPVPRCILAEERMSAQKMRLSVIQVIGLNIEVTW